MSLPGSGCCCGVIVGTVLSLLIAGIGTIAVYCWFNPDARKSAIQTVEKQWSKVKDFGDDVVDEIKDIDTPRSSEPIIKVDLD